MNEKDLKYFEELIQAKRIKILKELEHFEDNTLSGTVRDQAGDLSAYSDHIPDRATDSTEREKAFMFASKESQYLHYLNEALERIRSGTFGICRTCGGEIGKARLEAIPFATECIQCKSISSGERENRQVG